VLHACGTRAIPWSSIEHNLDVIKTADWIIDLGPEAATAAGASSRKHAEDLGRHRRELHRPDPAQRPGVKRAA